MLVYNVQGQYNRQTANSSTRKSFSSTEVQEITYRLEDMHCLIDVKNHPVVHSYIRGYMLRYRDKSEIILGRIPAYFPMFEEELRKAGLPEELKYLAVVESALDPRARSRSGAGGLWQFMPGTGKVFGLRQNKVIDERAEPLKATKAAIRFLKEEYERFGDWALVLAAYNGGPGRVRRAIRKSGKRDYWSLRKYLPRETRNYVPAFVAATYLYKYGKLHGLEARKFSFDEMHPVTISCPLGINITEIAQVTSLPMNLVKQLNPHIRKDFLPAGRSAAIRVPERCANSIKDYISWKTTGVNKHLVDEIRSRPIYSGGNPKDNDHYYHKSEYNTPSNIHLSEFARQHKLSYHHLKAWNPYVADYSTSPQSVVYYATEAKSRETIRPRAKKIDIPSIDKRRILTLAIEPQVMPVSTDGNMPNSRYKLSRYESLLDVWKKHSDKMTWQDFIKWNNIKGNSFPQPGTILLVRT